MVPSSTPALSAATMPMEALPEKPEARSAVATASTAAPKMMAAAPPSTLAQSRALEPRNSLKSRHPHIRPTRLFVFQSGKAIERPTLRTANMVRVLATAHSIPPSTAQTIRCGLSNRSSSTNPVPFKTVGSVQRVTNAPITIPMEMSNGENPSVTSLVGASALPSQTAADSAQITPSLCKEMVDRTGATARRSRIGSPQTHQKGNAEYQHDNRHPQVQVGKDGDERGWLYHFELTTTRAGPCQGIQFSGSERSALQNEFDPCRQDRGLRYVL